MVENFAYRLKGTTKWIDCGQCDEHDFLNFWRRMSKEIESAFIKRTNPYERKIFFRNLAGKGKWYKIK